MLLNVLLVKDLEIEIVNSMKMIIILILYLMHNIIFVENEFIVHLLLKKLKYMVIGVKIQNKEYYFSFMCRVNPYQVEKEKIIGFFLEMI